MGQREMFQRVQVLLHEDALEAAAWRAASVPLNEAYGATGNSLIVVDGLGDDRKPSFVRNLHRGQRREDLERDHFQNYFSHDERTLRLRQLPHGRLVLVPARTVPRNSEPPRLSTRRCPATAPAEASTRIGRAGQVSHHLGYGRTYETG